MPLLLHRPSAVAAGGEPNVNTYSQTASHFWDFTYGSNFAKDFGTVATASKLNMEPYTNAGAQINHCPGPTRGTPRLGAAQFGASGGCWLTSQSTRTVQGSGHTSGEVGGWFMIQDGETTGQTSMLGQWYAGNTAIQTVLFYNLATEKFEFYVRQNTEYNRVIQDSVCTRGTWYYVVAKQENDGTGIHLFINGVEDGTAAQNGATVGVPNAWFDNLATNYGAATDWRIGPGHSVAPSGTYQANQAFRVFHPYVKVNSTTTDADILTQYGTANLSGAPTDFYEWVDDNYGDLECWWPGYHDYEFFSADISPNLGRRLSGNPQFMELGNSGLYSWDANDGTGDFSLPGSAVDSPGPFVTDYHAGGVELVPGSFNMFGSSTQTSGWTGHSEGTVIFWARVGTSFAAEDTFWSINGTFGTHYIDFGVNTSGDLFWDVVASGSSSRRTVTGGAFSPLSTSTWYQFAVVNNGVDDVELYINGQIQTGNYTDTGGSNLNYWISDINALAAANNVALGSTAGSASTRQWAETNERVLGGHVYTNQVLTATEIANWYEASTGGGASTYTRVANDWPYGEHIYDYSINTVAARHFWGLGDRDNPSTQPDNGVTGGATLARVGTTHSKVPGFQPKMHTHDYSLTNNYHRYDGISMPVQDYGSIVTYVMFKAGTSISSVCWFYAGGSTTDLADAMMLGINPSGSGTAGRPGFALSSSSGNVGQWETTDWTTSDALSNEWYCWIINKETGQDPRMYLDGVELSLSYVTLAGTAPAQGVWNDDGYGDATIAIANRGYTSVSQNYTGYQGPVVYHSEALTAEQIAKYASFIGK